MADHVRRNSTSFPTTGWSAVRRAGQEGSRGPREALGELLTRYLPALRAHLVHKKALPRDQIDDVLQAFVADKILEHNLLAAADRRQGKFRTLLLTALDRYIISHRRLENAQKRSAERAVSLDDGRDVELASDEATPSHALDAAWACRVLEEAVHRMRRECRAAGRDDLWGVFETRVVEPALHGGKPLPYQQLVHQYRLSTYRQASNLVITGKRMFVRILRAVVSEYTPEEQINAEIDELRDALSRAGSQGTFRELLSGTLQPCQGDPASAAAMLSCDVQQRALWQADELAAILRHQLAAPLEADLYLSSPNAARWHQQFLPRVGSKFGSIADIFRCPQPPLELLIALRDFANDAHGAPDWPLPEEVATVLWLAAIAVALLRCRERITDLTDAKLRQGFQWAFDQPWLTEDLRSLFHHAVVLLS